MCFRTRIQNIAGLWPVEGAPTERQTALHELDSPVKNFLHDTKNQEKMCGSSRPLQPLGVCLWALKYPDELIIALRALSYEGKTKSEVR